MTKKKKKKNYKEGDKKVKIKSPSIMDLII